MKKFRMIALFLTLAMMFSLCAAAAPEAEKDSLANSIKAAAQKVLSASAMNMWMYEDNDMTAGTIQELAATPAAMSAPLKALGLNAAEISTFAEDLSFLREKTEYFKTMREEQDIRRNDFQLRYFFDEPEISGDRASLYVVESISFHYPELPDKLSEAVNYYDVELVRVGGKWLVAGVTAEGDDFDEAYKGTGFTAANAEACFAAAAERAAEYEMDVNELAEEYGFTVEDEAEVQAADTTYVYYNYNADNATAYAYTYVTGRTELSIMEKREYYNGNFQSHAKNGGDCQNFASQCVWAGFNGSNSKDQIYNATTNTYSPIMDTAGSYRWNGTIPGKGTDSAPWKGTASFRGYLTNEANSSSPDMIVKTGTLEANQDFSSVYSELKGAVLHVNGSPDSDGNPTPFGHAIVVTDVIGPSRSEVFFCGHTSDRKNLSIADRHGDNRIKYFIPQRMKIRSAPEIKITANLLRPEPVGSTVTVGGQTDQACYSLAMTVTPPDDLSVTTTLYNNKTSISRALQLTGEGLYIITITAQKTVSSDPVVYVYTVRAYQ